MFRHSVITLLLLWALSGSATAQSDWPRGYDVGHPGMLHLRTNLLYDALLLPSIGIETGFGQHWSAVLNTSFNWLKDDDRHRYWRILTADAEVRLWLSRNLDAFRKRGFHVGVYGAVYRYDFLFGGKGQQAKANWGVGLSCGYSLPVSSDFSFDFNIGVGYIGGKYKEYEPTDDGSGHYLWMADKKRNYFGPTKAEIAFVWHIGKSKRVKK